METSLYEDGQNRVMGMNVEVAIITLHFARQLQSDFMNKVTFCTLIRVSNNYD